MFEQFEPKKEKKENKKPEIANSFSLPGLNDNQINKFSDNPVKRLAPPPPALTDFSKRMIDLEAKGKKRGRRNMLIGTIGGAFLAFIVMCCVYTLGKDVSDISNKIDQDVNKFPDLNNRKKVEKIYKIDTDRDGLSDEDEAGYKTDPENPDTDGDGLLDGEEVRRGINPAGN